MTKPLPCATTPGTIAAACLAGAVFVPAVPAAAAGRSAAPADAVQPVASTGSLSVCQAMTNSLATDSAWNFVVRPKGSKKVVAGGLVPNGTKLYPACRTIVLPPGAYTVAETQKKQQPVVRIVVRHHTGATKSFTPAGGKALTRAGFRIAESAVTTVTFSNRLS